MPAHAAFRRWAGGFYGAMTLVPDAWTAPLEDDRTQILVAPFVRLIGLADAEPVEVSAMSASVAMTTRPHTTGHRYPSLPDCERRDVRLRPCRHDSVEIEVSRTNSCWCGKSVFYAVTIR